MSLPLWRPRTQDGLKPGLQSWHWHPGIPISGSKTPLDLCSTHPKKHTVMAASARALYCPRPELGRSPNPQMMAPWWRVPGRTAFITELIRAVPTVWEILFPWQMIYFIYFPWSSCIISILLILGKYIKKVINWQLWLCYGPQTAIIHYVSIINFTSNVFQWRLQKRKKLTPVKSCAVIPGDHVSLWLDFFSDLPTISGLEESK